MMEGSDEFVGPVNLGNPHEFSVRQLAELVLELSGSRSTIIQKRPLPADDPKQRCPDISRAKAELHWEPSIELREGLARTIEWFQTIDMADYRAPTPNF